MASPIVTAPMQAKAAKIADQLALLSTGTSKVTGQKFYVVPASNRLTAHWTAVDGTGCTCLGHQRRGTCTHSIAAKAVHEAANPAPRIMRQRYESLFPACPCGDIAEGKDGFCNRCASDREWEARRESARQHVAAQIADGVSFADSLNPLAE